MQTPRLRAAAFVFMTALLFAAACDEEDRATLPLTPTPIVTSSPTPPPPLPTPTTTGTGVPAELEHVNAIVNMVLRGEVENLERRMEFVSLPCGEQQGPGSPPACPPGAAPGTPAEVFPVTTCESELRPRGQARPALEMLARANPRLYAVYRAPDSYLPRDIDGDYVAVFTRQTPDQGTLGVGLVIRGERIVGAWFGCQATADRIVPPGTPAVIPPVPAAQDATPTR